MKNFLVSIKKYILTTRSMSIILFALLIGEFVVANTCVASTHDIYKNTQYHDDDVGYSYILYDINAPSGDGQHKFEDQARLDAKKYISTYLGTSVVLIGVHSASEFKNAWDSLVGFDEYGNNVSIDGIELIFHGSAAGFPGPGTGYLLLDDGSRISAGTGAIDNTNRPLATEAVMKGRVAVTTFKNGIATHC